MQDSAVLYIGAYLPRLSETFVYREIFELRRMGRTVRTASLHRPDAFAGDKPELQSLAQDTVVVYSGWGRLLKDAASEWQRHPRRSILTMVQSVRDGLTQRDASMKSRLVLPGQALAALALAARLKDLDVKHIHAHMAHAPTTLAMYTAMQLGIRFSFTGHAADLFRDRAFLSIKLERTAFAACISQWHQRFYQEEVCRPESDYPLVRCGVDPQEFAPDVRTPPVPHQPPLILGAGRLVRKKGFDVLLRALEPLHKAQVPFRCRIVGDGDEMEALKRLALDLGFSSKIEFTGACSNLEIRAMMKQATLFVLPCRIAPSGDRDGIPVVLMEAMACETCVVSGDLPTIRELVIDRDTGFMVPPGDVDGLSGQIRELLDNPGLRLKVAREGRSWVKTEFCLQKNVRRLLNAFESINPQIHGGSHE